MVDAASEWALYAAHRARLTRAVLESSAGNGGRLCLLGAGKCNDVDLELLGERFAEITLVDVDAPALAAAVSRQPPDLRKRLRPQVLDLSLLPPKRAGKWQRRAPSPADVQAVAATALREALARIPGPFQVVASVCMLTQLSFAVRSALGEKHAALALVRSLTMLLHLQTLLGLTAPGGTALFACDLTSSNHYPLGTLPADADLHEVQLDITRRGAAYYAGSPELVERMLREDPILSEQAGRIEALEPWLWTGPHDRTYLVYARRISRL